MDLKKILSVRMKHVTFYEHFFKFILIFTYILNPQIKR